MTQALKITEDRTRKLAELGLPYTFAGLADICNKAIEIALAEQATQEQFITADEARALGAWRVEFYDDTENNWFITGSQHVYTDSNKYRAIRKEVPSEPHAELKTKKQLDPAIREGVIALLQELNVLKGGR